MEKNIFKTMILLFGSIMTMGCNGSLDDVNTDPDNPLADQVPSTNILAFSERYASQNMFSRTFEITTASSYAGQVSEWLYQNESHYEFSSADNNSFWSYCDYALYNLKLILQKENPASNIWAAADIFQCQIWQVKTDRWGNIPYWTPTPSDNSLKNEALQLKEGISTPAYDKQELIYKDLLERLKNDVDVLETNSMGDDIGTGDVLLGADRNLWIKYGNALRLRLAARIANIEPALASKTFKAVLADGIIPESNNDNVFFNWNSEYAEPWADLYQQRPNEYGISELVVNTLQDELQDPRLDVYAIPTRAYTAYKDSLDAGLNPTSPKPKYVGFPIGLRKQASAKDNSKIGTRFQHHDDLTGFSPWLRSCETYFALAYAASKDLIPDDGKAKQYYDRAIRLSLEENGISTEAADAYLLSDRVKDASIDNIFTQWWISVFKNGQEAWSVYRMAPSDSYLFLNNPVAPESFFPGHNCPPMHSGYPDDERNLNPNCNIEAEAEVDYFWGKQMWWDTREGLK